jgi:hypothetical protein
MKNKILFFAIALFTFGSAEAQVKSRLIGLTKAVYDGTSFGTTGDTAWYKYTGLNDTLNNGQLAYDSSYLLAYLGGYTPGNLSYRYYHTVNSTNNINNAISQYYDTASAAWVNFDNNIFTYDALNNVTHFVHQVWDATTSSWVNNTNTLNTFVGTNNTLKIFQLWNTGTMAWVNNTRDSFYFNAGGDMAYHITQKWDTTALGWVNTVQVLDTYNTAHGITTLLRQAWNTGASAWVNNGHNTYHYNAATLQCNTIGERWDTTATAWIGTTEDSIVYYGTTSDKWHETRYRWDTAAHDFMPNSLDEFSYDANHNILSDTTLRWNPGGAGAFVNSRLRAFSYNTYNQVLTNTTASWSNTGAWYYKFTSGGGPNNGPDQQFRYYYELNTVGVNNVNATAGNLLVYPNPATSSLNIQLQWDAPQAFSIAIIDVKGSIVRQWSEPATKAYAKNVQLSGLPEGTYILRAYSQGKLATQQFIIAE